MKTVRTAFAGLAGMALAGSVLTATPAAAAVNNGGGPLPAGLTPINILSINDFHGRIDVDGKGTLGKNFACTYVTQRTALGGNLLQVAAGDLVGASPFTSAVQHDTPTIEYLNALGLQASGVGNHEFDAGWPDLRDRIEPLANFEYLGANVYLKGTTTPAMKTYETYAIGGLTVGVVGAVTGDTPNLVAGDGIVDLDFGDPVDGVNRVVGELTDGNAANGEADVIIAAYHEGGPYSSTTGTLADQLKIPIFAHLVNDTSPKVSAIFQGHTHQAYVYDVQIPGAASGQTRPVLQTGNYGGNVGKIQLGVDPATKQVTAYNAVNVPVTAATPACQADPTWQAAASIVDAAVAYAEPLANAPIGTVTSDITRAFDGASDTRVRESALGNLIAQQYLDSLEATGRPADIGIMNPGGIRADLLYGTDGTITFGQAATIMPFGNTIKKADYTGAQFIQVLEEQLQPEGTSRPYLSLGLSRNVTYTYDPSKPRGSRILSVFVNGAPIDPAKTYSVASSSFLITQAGNPDNFSTLLKGTNYQDSGLIDQNAFMDWIKANSPVSAPQVQHGVGVIVRGSPLQYGKQSGTFRLEGFDLASKGAVANTSVSIGFDGRPDFMTAPISSTYVATPLPTRDGVATFSFKMTGELLPANAKGSVAYLRVTAQPSGTVAMVPVLISK